MDFIGYTLYELYLGKNLYLPIKNALESPRKNITH